MSLVIAMMLVVNRFFETPPARPCHKKTGDPRQDVAEKQGEQHHDRLRCDNDQKQYGQDEKRKRLPLDQFGILEGIIAETRHHEEGKEIDQHQYRNFFIRTGPAKMIKKQNGSRYHAGGSRNRQSDKTLVLDSVNLDVETRQAQGATDDKQESGKPA